MLRDGVGVVKDETLSRTYYQIAIDEGYEYAYADLGHLLHRGIGGPVDLDEALRLYIEAIEHDVAYGGIGASYVILENPDDFPDPVMGLSLCFWAVENADPVDQLGYKDDCDYWAQDFQPSEIARANQMALQY